MRLTIALFIILLSSRQEAAAQTFSIDWQSIAGGGGTSAGGVFSVSGTLGQADAGAMSGGDFTIQGGFWSVVAAVQATGSPLLAIEQTNQTMRVFWPLPATDFVLEETLAMTAPPAAIAWSQIPAGQYQTNATHIFITLPMPVGSKFYRLRKP